MPPIQLSRCERASLSKFLERPLQPGEIPADHEEKFINYDLVRKRVLLMHITELGQMELLRQRFRGMRWLMPSEEPQPSRPLLPGR
jgi:hypothetical protein